MGSVMDQERPWERDAKPEGATLRERIKDVLRDKNRLHETVEQIVCELERLESLITTLSSESRLPVGWKLVPLEATNTMVDEGAYLQGGYDPLDMRAVYRAMIGAAPAPSHQVSGLEEKLWAIHAEEHAKLGLMLANKQNTPIATNWQGGRVNGIATALEVIRSMSATLPMKR